MYCLINKTNNSIVAKNVILAENFFSRLRGLMFKNEFREGCALIIKPCISIHTFFMKFKIDVVFLSKEGIVIHLIESMDEGKVSKIVRDALAVVELPCGTIEKQGIKLYDIFSLKQGPI